MSYQVKINIFEGPLDLLLHLIEKNDLDIYDIPISDITAEYLQYIDLLKELNLSLAGEFLVMAATLMQIKARTILPSDNHSDLNGPDPREELVQKLLEYQKFKEAARFLSQGYELQKDVYYRGAPLFSKEDQVLDLDLTKLLDAFNKVLQSTDKGIRDILVEEIPIEVRIREVLDMLESKPFIAFSELFPEGSSRRTLIITFLALLELIRLHQARVTQMAHFDEILIAKFADQNFVLEQETPAAEEVIKN